MTRLARSHLLGPLLYSLLPTATLSLASLDSIWRRLVEVSSYGRWSTTRSSSARATSPLYPWRTPSWEGRKRHKSSSCGDAPRGPAFELKLISIMRNTLVDVAINQGKGRNSWRFEFQTKNSGWSRPTPPIHPHGESLIHYIPSLSYSRSKLQQST